MLGLRGRTLGALLRKEAREVIRDRRTLLLTLVMPACLYPLLLFTLGEMTAAATLSIKAQQVTVAVMDDLAPDVRSALEKAEKVKPVPSTDPEADLRAHKVRVGLKSVPSKEKDADPTIRILVDKAQDESRAGADRIESILEKVREDRLKVRVRQLGIPESFIKPLPVDTENISSDERMGNYLLSRMLPFLLIIISLVGASATAVDTTAGERERGTLLTLMSAPVRAGEVAAAKLLVTAAVALCAGGANILSVGVSMSSFLQASPLHVSLSARTVISCVIALLPTTLYGAALLLGLGALGKSTKEAQSAQAPALFVSMALAGVVMAPGVKAGPVVNALPVAGPALLMRDLLMGDATLSQGLTVFCASAIMLWLMVSFAARILTSEPMLSAHLSTSAVIKDLSGQRTPTTLTAATMACVVMACLVLIAPLLQGRDMVLGLLATQVMLFVIPCGLLALLKLDVRAVIGWRAPPLRMVIAGALLGITCFMPMSILEMAVLHGSGLDDVMHELQKALDEMFNDLPSPLHMVLLIGVVPGIFEELAFRGALQGVLLRVAKPASSVVIQAFLFGLAHQSIARFPPTFLLGLLMGVLRWRSGSILPGMVLHVLNNGLAVGLSVFAPEAMQGFVDEPASGLGPLLAADVLVLCGGLWLLWRQETVDDRAR